MKLEVVDRIPGTRILWTGEERSLGASGNRLLLLDSSRRGSDLVAVGGGWERGLSRLRLTRHFLRLGIHHFLPLVDGGFLVVIRKRVFRLAPDGRVESTFRVPRGNKPAARGVCVTPSGDVFVAEYALNGDRTLPAMLHRSRDGGRTFEVVHAFDAGKIRHYHFVQWDPYARCLWMGTGDADSECLLFRSTDGGDRWSLVGGGSQLWRAVGVAFRPDALYWGTDAGSDAGAHPNFVMRLDRESGRLERVLELQGPCHGNAVLKDGTVLVSTGVERGKNEKDGRAHLWASREGTRWVELTSFAKDRWPGIVQFGVIRFPQGIESGDDVVFTCLGLSGAAETTFVARITEAA